MDLIKDWPPVTRLLVVGTLVLSLLVHTGFLDIMRFIYHTEYISRLPPQLWRIITSFAITGPKLGILFDPYFLYTYSTALERSSSRFLEHGAYFTYIAFVMTIVVILGGHFLTGFMLLQPLILALAYTFAQDNPSSNVTVFILTFPAKYLPYALLIMTLITAGPDAALLQLTGLIAAHLYDFLTRIWPTFGGGRNWLQTPAFIKQAFAPRTRGWEQRSYGKAMKGSQSGAGTAPGAGAGAGAAVNTAAVRDAWSNQRGPGRRLGGD